VYGRAVHDRPLRGGSGRRVVVGTLAILGGYLLAAQCLFVIYDAPAWALYGAHLLAPAVAGALVAACTPVRPTREPLVAGALAVAVMVLLFIAAPHPELEWVVATQPWWAVLGVAAISAAGAVGGAVVGRAITSRLAGRTAVAALSALVVLGTMIVIVHAAIGFLGNSFGAVIFFAVLVGFAAAGFLVQAVVPADRRWACAAGGAIGCIAWPMSIVLSASLEFVILAVPCALLVHLGARVGWRRHARHHAEAPGAPLPEARVRSAVSR
jgi:hypothetical protein